MLNNLGERCNKILRFLLRASDYVSTLKIVRGKGIFIPPDEKISIDALADKRDARNEYIFSPGERAKIIACYVIQSESPVYVDRLMEACQVSRNTIFGDIQILIRQLHEYNVKLSYAPKIRCGFCLSTGNCRF